MIVLDPISHTYLDRDNNKYKSVTTLIGEFAPKFDFEEKSKKYAAKHGLDVEEVRANWKQKNRNSTDFGTKIHSEIEHLLTEGVYNGESLHKEAIETLVDRVIKDFKPADFHHEHAVYLEKYRVAGTADLIAEKENSFSIIDFKTNKEIKTYNDYDKFFLDPISHLPNGEYFKYSLQLSFYAYFYHLHTGKHIDRLCLYWLSRKKTDSYDDLKGCKWVRYNLPFLKEEILDILEYAKKD